MSHTPGPWYVGAMTDQLYIINEPPRPAPKDHENTSLGTRAIAKTFEAPGGFAEEEANARLIAQAWTLPQLRAALESIAKLSVGGPHVSAKDGMAVALLRLDEARSIARAALRAADGEGG